MKIILFKIILILFNFVFILLTYKHVHKNYQLNGYNITKTLGNIIINSNNAYILFFLVIFNLLYIISYDYFTILFAFSFACEALILSVNLKGNKEEEKNKLVFTKRFTRFFVLFLLLNLTVLILTLFIKEYFIYFVYINYYLISILLFALSHFLLLPIELIIKKIYILKAKNKIKKMPNLLIIGITGSFGKTSVKNYVYEFLKTKYKVCKTQKSFNTEMGFTKVILNDLKIDDEILILEYGADHIHDINKLCKIAKPDFSIITGVTNQHLKTFKTFENIIATKYELVENTNKNGFVVFNKDNEITKDFYNKTNIKKFLVSSKSKADLYAKNIILNIDGTDFTLKGKDNLNINIHTKLLGKHNVINLLLSISLALNFQIGINEIVETIKKIEPVEHRLNLIENNGRFILDDSFNANNVGVYSALEVLKTFKGKRIVITGGIVELGDKEYEENYKLGNALKDFDVVIITNFINKTALLDGLKHHKNKVFAVGSLNGALKILQNNFNKGDCVLFLNDLPDNYE